VSLKWQADGNLVLYCRSTGKAMWASNTKGEGVRLAWQSDGNLVIYDRGGSAVFATNTDGNSKNYALLQPDGNFVIYNGVRYDGQSPLWSTGTDGRC
jgi:hypothetical protein